MKKTLECSLSIMNVVLYNIHALKMIKKKLGGVAGEGDFKVLCVSFSFTLHCELAFST